MSRSRTRKPVRPSVRPRVKVWLETDSDYVFGHGISEILKAIESTGSIKSASRELRKSYRYVWSRVKDAEEALGYLLVETRVGGHGVSRSSLTDTARQLISAYDQLRQRMMYVVDAEFAACFEQLFDCGARHDRDS